MTDCSNESHNEIERVDTSEDIDTSTNRIDITVSATKVIVSLVPFLGPILSELVTTLVPNQRMDRIERFLRMLDAKVEIIDQNVVKDRFRDPAFVNLFEDGAYQAARALSEERIAYIASIVAHGLSDADVDFIRSKHLLTLLNELNDAQVIMLQSYTLYGQEQIAFRDVHADVLVPPLAARGASPEAYDETAIHNSFLDQLVRFGLLRLQFRKPKKGEFPEFDDKSGMMKSHGRQITQLGKLLLKHIDLLNNDEG